MTRTTDSQHFPGSDTPTGPIPVPTPRRRARSGPAAMVAGMAVLAAVLGGAGGALLDHSLTGPDAVTTTTARTTSATAGDGSVAAVAAKVLPSVVQITQQGLTGAGIGSGVVLTSDGEILTNYHVISGGGSLTVTFADGRKATATVVGTSPSSDLALVRAQNVSDLTPAALGDSSAVRVGQEVVAIGSPEGLRNTVTSGIVSALHRQVTVADRSQQTAFGQPDQVTYDAIQTDASINPGNSGGPLLDMNGNVIGINSAIYSPTSSPHSQGGSVGLGFAIPSNQAKTIIHQLENQGM